MAFKYGAGVLVGASLFCAAGAVARADTLAYWKFEPDALTADSSGNGRTLTNNGVTSSADAASAVSQGSAVFNGTSASFVTAANLNLSAASQLTFETFYKTAGFTAAANDADILFEHSPNFNFASGAVVTFGASTGTANELFAGKQVGGGYNVDRVSPAPAGGWTHLAVQFDKSAASNSDVIKVFVNYALVATTEPNATSQRAAFLDSLFYLGARGGNSLFYAGQLDEFRISDVLLSPSQFIQVPEPASAGILVLAGLTVLARRRTA